MKAFLFDVDGVLFDAVEAIYQTYLTVLNGRCFPTPSRAQVERDFGSVAPKWFDEIGVEITRDLREEITRRYAEEFFPKHARVNKDALPVLNELRSRGCKLGVVTNQTRAQADSILPRLGFDFDCVVTMNEGEPKPSPELLLVALNELEAEKAESLFVGDAKVDEQAATAAGVEYRILARPYNARLDNRIESLRELLDVE